MHKTLHKKFTGNNLAGHTHNKLINGGGMLLQDANLLKEIAKDLLQPRPQAVANLLKMAKTV
ncbi:MAG: hypothetical protein K0Q79_2641 [Flavipsychrobacter sp.]|jgi:hypothetical protein|nr:hypothetical protein [Flavipsychrobacter sp.]